MKHKKKTKVPTGKVFLVGAGPGDAQLLTLRGKTCLEEADTVIYDYLADPEILQHTQSNTERIYVGKMANNHSMKQDDINSLLVCKAKEGKTDTYFSVYSKFTKFLKIPL